MLVMYASGGYLLSGLALRPIDQMAARLRPVDRLFGPIHPTTKTPGHDPAEADGVAAALSFILPQARMPLETGVAYFPKK